MSLRYKLFGIPANLDEFIDKSKRKKISEVFIRAEAHGCDHRIHDEMFNDTREYLPSVTGLVKCSFSKNEYGTIIYIKGASSGEEIYERVCSDLIKRTVDLKEQYKRQLEKNNLKVLDITGEPHPEIAPHLKWLL